MFIVSHCQGGAGAGELDDEDQEEDDHVEEQEDLVVPDSADQPDDWDEEEEDSGCGDTSDDGKVGYDARHFTCKFTHREAYYDGRDLLWTATPMMRKETRM